MSETISNKALQMFDQLRAVLNEKEVNYSFNDEELTIETTLFNCRIPITLEFSVDAKKPEFTVHSPMSFLVVDKFIYDVYMALNKINYEEKFGSFCYDFRKSCLIFTATFGYNYFSSDEHILDLIYNRIVTTVNCWYAELYELTMGYTDYVSLFKDYVSVYEKIDDGHAPFNNAAIDIFEQFCNVLENGWAFEHNYKKLNIIINKSESWDYPSTYININEYLNMIVFETQLNIDVGKLDDEYIDLAVFGNNLGNTQCKLVYEREKRRLFFRFVVPFNETTARNAEPLFSDFLNNVYQFQLFFSQLFGKIKNNEAGKNTIIKLLFNS